MSQNNKTEKKRFLFFFVHPSKFHMFRNTINYLKNNGHHIDVLITQKDVLEELVKNEGWNYKNIFPKGRKIKNLPTYISAGYNFIRTIIRIERYLLKQKKYDLFISDDLLTISGWFHKTPTIHLQIDDVRTIPVVMILYFAKHLLSPSCCYVGRFRSKKISFDGYRELAYLHPRKFLPDKRVIERFHQENSRYFLLRLVSLKSTHDVGKKGLNDEDVKKLIKILEKYGKVYITSERKIPKELNKYRLNIRPNDIAHVLYYADLLIADSQTMSAEAGVLGTPFIRYNDFIGVLSYLNELENKYLLGFGIKTKDKDKLFTKIEELAKNGRIKQEWEQKRNKMLSEKIDLTDFMIWLLENYPDSYYEISRNPDYQYNFK